MKLQVVQLSIEFGIVQLSIEFGTDSLWFVTKLDANYFNFLPNFAKRAALGFDD